MELDIEPSDKVETLPKQCIEYSLLGFTYQRANRRERRHSTRPTTNYFRWEANVHPFIPQRS